jgi:uncharacterized protein (DUF1697 family)
MPTHIAFLRAINVGKRKYPMAELRKALTDAGYGEVATHIQTGNVLLRTPTRSRERLEAQLERLFLADRGFEVATVVLSPAELTRVAADMSEIAEEHPPRFGHYVSLLKKEPTRAAATRVEEHGHPGETAVVRGRAVHLLYDKPYHEARVSNAFVEKHLGVATNRNAKVIRALADKWGG